MSKEAIQISFQNLIGMLGSLIAAMSLSVASGFQNLIGMLGRAS